MSMLQSPLGSDAYQAELAAQGQALYEAKLKALLEPDHNGEYIVIHVDTEDYALRRTFHEAGRILQLRHPKDGRMVGWKIGPEPDEDYLAGSHNPYAKSNHP